MSVWKGYPLYNDNDMTLGKRQNNGDIKKKTAVTKG